MPYFTYISKKQKLDEIKIRKYFEYIQYSKRPSL